MNRTALLAAAALAASTLAGCAGYYAPPPPPPPGYAGEGWPAHVRRCLRRFPRYDPRTDTVYRPSGAFRCPL